MNASLNSVISGSGNGLTPDKWQAIIHTNADLLSVRQSWFNEIWIKTKRFTTKRTWTIRLKNNINFVQASLLMTCSCVIRTCCHYICSTERPALLRAMIWCWLGNEPLSKTVMTNGLHHVSHCDVDILVDWVVSCWLVERVSRFTFHINDYKCLSPEIGCPHLATKSPCWWS